VASSGLHLQSTENDAVEDDPDQSTLPRRFRRAMPADRLVIRICQVGAETQQRALHFAIGRQASGSCASTPRSTAELKVTSSGRPYDSRPEGENRSPPSRALRCRKTVSSRR
jgi:hypothetical protein